MRCRQGSQGQLPGPLPPEPPRTARAAPRHGAGRQVLVDAGLHLGVQGDGGGVGGGRGGAGGPGVQGRRALVLQVAGGRGGPGQGSAGP